jgi:hypothetical protein
VRRGEECNDVDEDDDKRGEPSEDDDKIAEPSEDEDRTRRTRLASRRKSCALAILQMEPSLGTSVPNL